MKNIVTHNGVFHADEVFAIAMFHSIGSGEVTRTRDPKIIAAADIVIDVGGEYDPQTNRFDHHQGGVGARADGIPYASAGLVWWHIGTEVVKAIIDSACEEGVLEYVPLNATKLWEIVARVDALLIRGIDAADTATAKQGDGMTVSAQISSLNPTWLHRDMQEPGSALRDKFFTASRRARAILRQVVIEAYAQVAAFAKVMEAADVREDPRVLVLETYLPWREAVVEKLPDVKLIVFPALGSTDWMVQVAPKFLSGFESRVDLPLAWKAKNKEKLVEVCGVPDAVFCHQNLFICGAHSRRGALRMAQAALS